jgi:hypothetical protein
MSKIRTLLAHIARQRSSKLLAAIMRGSQLVAGTIPRRKRIAR